MGGWPVPPSMSKDSEVRMTDPDSGAQKGMKLERYDLVPAYPLALLAKHYGVGAQKYDEWQWRGGYKWSLSFAAMMRHAWAFWRGEDIDEETGSPHLIAVVWHAFALLEFGRIHPEKDDRPTDPFFEKPKPNLWDKLRKLLAKR